MAGDGTPGWLSGMASFLTMGAQLALSVVVFFFLGRWLDGHFGTAPWLMLAGLALGITGGFIKFFRTAASLSREADEKRRTEGRPGPHEH